MYMQLLPSAAHFCFSSLAFDIEPLTSEHIKLYSELYGDIATMRYVAEPLSEQRLAVSFSCAVKFNTQVPAKRLFLVIVDRQTGAYLGLLGVSELRSVCNSVEVGIMLLPKFHQQGVAQTALVMLCAKVFALMPGVTIIGKLDPKNSAAKKLVAKLGFVYCSETGNYTLVPDKFLFRMTAEGVK